MITRREQMLNLTADIRAEMSVIRRELAKIDAEMDNIRNPTVRLVRLSDRRWDLTARFNMLCRQMDARVNAFAA